MNGENKTVRKMTLSIASVIILAVCLLFTTLALVYSVVSVDNNLFTTGKVKINLNDGKPFIEEGEFIFEPGMTVKKDFFIQNESTLDVYYKIYFDNIDGGLSDVLDVTVSDGNNVLYTGKVSELTKENVSACDSLLKLGERKTLSVTFHYPENALNSTQNMYLTFTLGADAVQTKNNPDKLFA